MAANIRLPFEMPDTPEKVWANCQALYEFITNVEAQTEAFKDIKIADGATTKFITDSTGRSKQPNNCSFSAVMSGTQSFTLAGSILPIDTKTYDLGTNFSTVTHLFTAPISGGYLFTFTGYAQITSGGSNTGNTYIQQNVLAGGTVKATTFVSLATAIYLPVTVALIANCAAGDTVGVYQVYALGDLGSGLGKVTGTFTGTFLN